MEIHSLAMTFVGGCYINRHSDDDHSNRWTMKKMKKMLHIRTFSSVKKKLKYLPACALACQLSS